ncbi:MAG: GLUG motif-containing protein [bacterium]
MKDNTSSLWGTGHLVFTWNGIKYDYIGDTGQVLHLFPNGSDYLPIAGDRLKPLNNKYSIKVSEEYNEIVYYDELALRTYDHAPGYKVATTLERGKKDQVYTVSENPSNPLLSCTDKYSKDCQSDLSEYDDKWSYKDQSNLNYWTVNFGDLSQAERILLVIQGAEDYTVSTVPNARTIQVKDAQGKWITVFDQTKMSTTGGSPKLQIIDMTGKFPTNNYDVRLSFNRTRMNYLAVDTSLQQELTVNTLHPTTSDLQFHGFSSINKEFFWDHNYDNISPNPPNIFAEQSGNFTKYGDVSPLLQGINNQYVVMHYGDQISAEFDYIPPASGLERDFVLFSYVNYKHAKTGTVGRSVEPLPFYGMIKYPYSSPQTYPMTPENIEYLKFWNTRVIKSHKSGGGSTVINSHSSATVSGTGYVGGLVGDNQKLITGSYATGQVISSGYYSGGLVGRNYNPGEINNSYATGNVETTQDYAGGLVGYNTNIITNTYATGTVTGLNYLGGLAGQDDAGISNSFSTGNVVGGEGGLHIGGFVGAGTQFDLYNGLNFWFNTTQTVGVDDVANEPWSLAKSESTDYFKSNLSNGPFPEWSWSGVNQKWSVVSNGYPALYNSSIYVQVDTELETGGITSNIGEILDHTSSIDLYFEKPDYGKVQFAATLDLTDPTVIAWLQELGTKLNLSINGQISLDADTIKDLINTQAILTMYNITLNDPKILVDGADDNFGVVTNLVYDPITHTLTFNAAHFTTFKAVEKTSSSTSSNTSSSSASSADSSCNDPKPNSTPDLFQINSTGTTAKIFFTPLSDTNKFYISYSTKPKAEEHGVEIELSKEGVQNYTIKELKPNTIYYYKVRGQNGCASGDWSNILAAKTGSRFSTTPKSYFKKPLIYKPLISSITTTKKSKLAPIISPIITPSAPETVQHAIPEKQATETPKLKKCFLWLCW